MSRSLVCNAVERVKRQLASSFRYEVNLLQSALSANSTTISLTYDLPPSVIPGAVISIAHESMRVMDVDIVNQTFTVIRGWHGSDQMTVMTTKMESHWWCNLKLSDCKHLH